MSNFQYFKKRFCKHTIKIELIQNYVIYDNEKASYSYCFPWKIFLYQFTAYYVMVFDNKLLQYIIVEICLDKYKNKSTFSLELRKGLINTCTYLSMTHKILKNTLNH